MLSYLISLLWLAFFFLLIQRWSFFDHHGIKRLYFHLAFALKVLCAAIMLWLYTDHYTVRSDADIFKYYDDGLIVASIADESVSDFAAVIFGSEGISEQSREILQQTKYWDRSPSIAGLNENRLIIRINAAFSFLSLQNVFTHMLAGAFIAFLGLKLIFSFFLHLSPHRAKAMLILVFAIPSVLFWTSAMLKESFMILGMGGMIYWGSSAGYNWRNLLPAFLSLILLLMSKWYLAIIVLPAMLAYRWNSDHNDKKAIWRYLALNAFIWASILTIAPFFGISPGMVLADKQYEFKCLAEWMDAGSLVHVPDINGSLRSFITASPMAIYNSLFRPAFWDNLNALSAVAMLEISLSWLLVLLAILARRKDIDGRLGNLILFVLNITLPLALLIGWTTPVMGAIVRYRIPVLLLMLPTAILLVDAGKVKWGKQLLGK